jgi:hypothetical protein
MDAIGRNPGQKSASRKPTAIEGRVRSHFREPRFRLLSELATARNGAT